MPEVAFYDSDVYGSIPTKGLRVVYTAGTFDIVHKGHINLLNQCRRIAGRNGLVCVGVNSDAFIQKYRNRAPIMSESERSVLIGALRSVDAVLLNDDPQQAVIEKAFLLDVPRMTVSALMSFPPTCERFLVIGSDWASRDYYKQIDVTQEWLDKHYITLCYVPYTEGISSSEIKWRVRQ